MSWSAGTRPALNVQARLPVLSTFLGHGSPEATYWYLQATPNCSLWPRNGWNIHAANVKPASRTG